MLAEQLAPLLALAARKGVTDLVPGWLHHKPEEPAGQQWFIYIALAKSSWLTLDDAAALIITGSLSKWLAGQGIAVVQSLMGLWLKIDIRGNQEVIDGHLDDPHIDALISAATARLEEMQDKEKADGRG